jgi:hypothetical protein
MATVARRAHVTVGGKRVRAHDEIFNAVGVEC